MESEKESLKDLIVDVGSTEVQIALMDNHKLIELNKESSSGRNFNVGDVYLGRVKKVMPALNAAFVDIGVHEDGLIHISEMSKSFVNHPSQVVSVGDLVTVWVSKVDLEHEKLNLSLVNPRESN